MNSAEFLQGLLEATVATAAAVALVLLLRTPMRRAFGPAVGYAVWALVPTSLLAVLLPARRIVDAGVASMQIVPGKRVMLEALPSAGTSPFDLLLVIWLLGAVGMACRFAMQQRAFRKGLGTLRRRDDGCDQAETALGLPAAMGLWHPRVVVPHDFDSRYSSEQRELMRQHERIHIQRGDLHANAAMALFRCLFWFNPLIHAASRHFRHDQELACDAAVVARHPQHRRAYGEAMLHTQLASQPLPLGCHWGFSHPLKERIEMLKRNPSSMKCTAAGSILVGVLVAGVGTTAWAAQPVQGVSASGTAGSASENGSYLLGARARIDDSKVMTSTSRMQAGKEALLSFEHAGQHWEVGLTLSPRADGRFDIASRILHGGRLEASPRLLVSAGEDAVLTVGENADGRMTRGLELSVVVGRVGTDSVFDDTRLRVPPLYPVEAARQGVGGVVWLLIDIDAEGKPLRVQVERAAPEGVFDAAALEAAYEWRFDPELKDGQAVLSTVRVPVDFEPTNASPVAPGPGPDGDALATASNAAARASEGKAAAR